MKVAWVGTFDPTFSRNRKLARLLDLMGAEVDVINVAAWQTDRVAAVASGVAMRLVRVAVAEVRLLWRLIRLPTPDVFLVSYPGWFDVPVVALIARIRRRRLVFDPFISLHDTAVADRALVSDTSVQARAMAWIDRRSYRLPDVVLADTPQHADFYRSWSGSRASFEVLWLGADDSVFSADPAVVPENDLIVFHGTFVPLQGIDVILDAMTHVEGDARLILIGDGQERAAMERRAADLGLTNVEFLGMVPLTDLPSHLARAAVCLGIFGSSDKAARVVPNKAYEALATGRPLITARTPATESAFREGEAVLVPPFDSEALANAIVSVLDDPESALDVARRGLGAYQERFHELVLSDVLRVVLQDT